MKTKSSKRWTGHWASLWSFFTLNFQQSHLLLAHSRQYKLHTETGLWLAGCMEICLDAGNEFFFFLNQQSTFVSQTKVARKVLLSAELMVMRGQFWSPQCYCKKQLLAWSKAAAWKSHGQIRGMLVGGRVTISLIMHKIWQWIPNPSCLWSFWEMGIVFQHSCQGSFPTWQAAHQCLAIFSHFMWKQLQFLNCIFFYWNKREDVVSFSC